ncbi:MAG: hypothetical protein AVDCRST_MAG31-2374 [uncultured Sphingomonas sp.]|uniref:Uncharacterized protein n=1 Tax=uncultured Sphingomonas sp. TaxID=158754 RepID=A0A6J4TSB8_9SPHN|nr:hypothetical protein [uncultured Sphingomonas sp.]CAA9530856.1 MAG: hypothetical protein AVDCRST_MAG31-2374 [uncultured Sphingomonas sp.]
MLWKSAPALAAVLAFPAEASAATIVIFTDTMTLERRAVVVNASGPDRLLFCAAPPAVSGCREVPLSRRR